MADTPPGQPQQAQPPAAAGHQPGQPPFGSSPATGPTQNRGQEAAAARLLAVISDGLVQCLQLVGANSEPGKVILESIKKLAGLVPAGSVTPQDKMAVLQKLGMEAQKQGQQMQMMRQQQQQQPHPGGQPGQSGAPGQPGAAPPQMPAAA